MIRKPNSLGNMIKHRRVMSGLTLAQLAYQCKISPSQLGRIENGVSFPSPPTLRRIAGPLELDECELLFRAVMTALYEPGISRQTARKVINSLRGANLVGRRRGIMLGED